jgi:prolyl oligopeptidase
MMSADPSAEDPFLWLEDVLGERALAWVGERNRESQGELTALPSYAELRPRLLAVLNARDRIPQVTRRGKFFYNFWQDAGHQRGLWRRTTLAQYRQPEPAWQTLLDLDALAATEGEDWVWKGATCLAPRWHRALVQLSRGGADASVVREFDLDALQFVADGFALPEAKSDVSWLDHDTLLVGTDFGPGTLTDSGYPRLIKRWRRGTPLVAAQTLFAGEPGDVSAWASVELHPKRRRVLLGRSVDFYNTRAWLWRDGGEAGPGTLTELPKPSDAELDLHDDWMALKLRSEWAVGADLHPSGSLLVAKLDAFLAGRADWQRVFTPGERRSLDHWAWTRSQLLLNVLDQVSNRVEACALPGEGVAGDQAPWVCRAVDLPGPGALSVVALNDPWTDADPLAEQFLVHYTDFLTPDRLMLASLDGTPPSTLKQRPAQFDASGMRVEQRLARSADGTQVPYFIVWPAGAMADGDNPTLLYGYGGFEVSLQPWYSGVFGQAWFGRGGVLVVANIRGGGEFGPAWHQAAVKAHKQRSYDDFIAVAEDLKRSGVTRPARLGIMGGSNGGLLVGAAFTQRPELFGAVVCQVPLLDMRRYHRLLAGASWMAEYGDPDQPDDWAVIRRYSPYHQLSANRVYPRVLLTTSTRDDRVHPGHARKVVARLQALGHPVLYYENVAGGHGGAADNEQRAHLQALEYSYLWAQLGQASVGD